MAASQRGVGKTTLEMTTIPYVGVYDTWYFSTIWMSDVSGYPILLGLENPY